MERILAHCAGWTWEDAAPKEKYLPRDWQERVPEAGSVKDILVVRGALFSDGPCKGDEKPNAYRAITGGDLTGTWSISRRDMAHFIVETALKDWSRWGGKVAKVAY